MENKGDDVRVNLKNNKTKAIEKKYKKRLIGNAQKSKSSSGQEDVEVEPEEEEKAALVEVEVREEAEEPVLEEEEEEEGKWVEENPRENEQTMIYN